MPALQISQENIFFRKPTTTNTLLHIYFYSLLFCVTADKWFPLPFTNYICDILFLVVLVNAASKINFHTHKFPHAIIIITIFIALSTAFSVYNNNSISAIILSIRHYKHIALFMIISTLPHNAIIDIDKKITTFAYLSVPIAIAQRIISTNSTGDDVGGLFGLSSPLSFVLLMVFFNSQFNRSKLNNKTTQWHWLLLLPIFINETKISYFLFPLLTIASLLIRKRITLSIVFTIAASTPICIATANYLSVHIYKQSIYDLFSAKFYSEYFMSDWGVDQGRMLKLNIIYNNLKQRSALETIMGSGLGSSFVGRKSNIYGTTAYKLKDSKVLDGTQMQVIPLYIDFGIAGLAVCMLSLSLSLGNIFRICRSHISLFAFKSMLLLVITIMGLLYMPVLTDPSFSFILFFYLFAALRLHKSPSLNIVTETQKRA